MPRARARHAARRGGLIVKAGNDPRRFQMPIILWLLGVPLSIVLLLMLFGVL
ncbi:MAG: hypothetical protein V4864_22685 [Pseudomonadota bacterium]